MVTVAHGQPPSHSFNLQANPNLHFYSLRFLCWFFLGILRRRWLLDLNSTNNSSHHLIIHLLGSCKSPSSKIFDYRVLDLTFCPIFFLILLNGMEKFHKGCNFMNPWIIWSSSWFGSEVWCLVSAMHKIWVIKPILT